MRWSKRLVMLNLYIVNKSYAPMTYYQQTGVSTRGESQTSRGRTWRVVEQWPRGGRVNQGRIGMLRCEACIKVKASKIIGKPRLE